MRRNVHHLAVVISCFCIVSQSRSADLGRETIDQGNVRQNFTETRIAGLAGIDAGVDINSVSWKVGSESYSDRSGSPNLSVYYGVTESLDIRGTVKYMSMKDGEDEEISDLSLFRLGFGGRVWWPWRDGFYPYVGPALNYYFIDDGVNGNADGAVGASIDAGISYLLENTVMFRIGVGYESTLVNGKVLKDGEKKNVSLSAAGLGAGVVVLF